MRSSRTRISRTLVPWWHLSWLEGCCVDSAGGKGCAVWGEVVIIANSSIGIATVVLELAAVNAGSVILVSSVPAVVGIVIVQGASASRFQCFWIVCGATVPAAPSLSSPP